MLHELLDANGSHGVTAEELYLEFERQGVAFTRPADAAQTGTRFTTVVSHLRQRLGVEDDPDFIQNVGPRPGRPEHVFMWRAMAFRDGVDTKYFIPSKGGGRKAKKTGPDLAKWIEKRKTIKQEGRLLLRLIEDLEPMLFWEDEALYDEVKTIVDVIEKVHARTGALLEVAEDRMSDDRLQEKIESMTRRAHGTTFAPERDVSLRKAAAAQAKLDARKAARSGKNGVPTRKVTR